MRIFPRDGILNPFHNPVSHNSEEMIKERPGGISHVMEGVGLSDSSSTSEQFGGLAERGSEWSFISLHLNTVTSMSALGGLMLLIGILLYCSSKQCWYSIWRSIKCCRCAIEPQPPRYEEAISYSPATTSTATTSPPTAPTPGETETLEQSKYLRLGKQKKKNTPKEVTFSAETKEGESSTSG